MNPRCPVCVNRGGGTPAERARHCADPFAGVMHGGWFAPTERTIRTRGSRRAHQQPWSERPRVLAPRSSMGNVAAVGHASQCYLPQSLQGARNATMTDMRARIEAKSHARTAAKQVRAVASARHGSTAAQRLADQGLAFSGVGRHAVVSGFCAIGDEIDPLPLLAQLSADGHQVCLPVMQGKGCRCCSGREAGRSHEGRTVGIGEPLPSAPYVEPGVRWCRCWHSIRWATGLLRRRLLRSHAHRTEERLPVIAIGLAFDEQRVDAVPHVDYDQRLDWVLTPSGPLRTK